MGLCILLLVVEVGQRSVRCGWLGGQSRLRLPGAEVATTSSPSNRSPSPLEQVNPPPPHPPTGLYNGQRLEHESPDDMVSYSRITEGATHHHGGCCRPGPSRTRQQHPVDEGRTFVRVLLLRGRVQGAVLIGETGDGTLGCVGLAAAWQHSAGSGRGRGWMWGWGCHCLTAKPPGTADCSQEGRLILYPVCWVLLSLAPGRPPAAALTPPFWLLALRSLPGAGCCLLVMGASHPSAAPGCCRR